LLLPVLFKQRRVEEALTAARQTELMAGKELEREGARFKYLFANSGHIDFEQFLGILNSKPLCHVVPVITCVCTGVTRT